MQQLAVEFIRVEGGHEPRADRGPLGKLYYGDVGTALATAEGKLVHNYCVEERVMPSMEG